MTTQDMGPGLKWLITTSLYDAHMNAETWPIIRQALYQRYYEPGAWANVEKDGNHYLVLMNQDAMIEVHQFVK